VPLIVLLTDGRATGRPDAVDDALAAAATVRRAGVAGLVLDCETTAPRLGLAAQIAEAMGAPLVPVPAVDADTVHSIVRSAH
jgi:magnesium chelatase subunit D